MSNETKQSEVMVQIQKILHDNKVPGFIILQDEQGLESHVCGEFNSMSLICLDEIIDEVLEQRLPKELQNISKLFRL